MLEHVAVALGRHDAEVEAEALVPDDGRLRVAARDDLATQSPSQNAAISAGASEEVAMRSRSRTVSRRRRTLPASETAIAAGCARSSSTTRLHRGERGAEQAAALRGVLRPRPASSAFRIFSSLFAPSPERSRSRPSSAAALRPSSVVTPSSVQIRAAVFGPMPGQPQELDDAARHALRAAS